MLNFIHCIKYLTLKLHWKWAYWQVVYYTFNVVERKYGKQAKGAW